MSTAPHENVLCRYHYDPLDRLTGSEPSAAAALQRFYCKSRLATEVQGAVHTSVFQHKDQLLAQQQCQGTQVDISLLATDQQRSVLNALGATRPHPLAYSPYGHRPLGSGLLSLLGFNGERPDPLTGHYLLGNGYRAFNPVLMRFNNPDSWSPFGDGGLNAYAYCAGDPVNRVDPNGRSWTRLINFIDSQNLKFRQAGISQHTIDSINETTAKLGGEKSVIKQAKKLNTPAEKYLVSEMPESKPLPPMSNPEPNVINRLTQKQRDILQINTSKTISNLERRYVVQNDLIYGLNNPEEVIPLRQQTDQALSQQKTLFKYLSDLPPAYEPPPSFQDAMRNIRKK